MYAEDLNYWQTGKSDPDQWVEKAMENEIEGARQADQPTGKAPCRQCGEPDLHFENCDFVDARGFVNERIRVLDSERVASGEGLRECVNHCEHESRYIRDGVCQFGSREWWGTPCGHRCETDGQTLPCKAKAGRGDALILNDYCERLRNESRTRKEGKQNERCQPSTNEEITFSGSTRN